MLERYREGYGGVVARDVGGAARLAGAQKDLRQLPIGEKAEGCDASQAVKIECFGKTAPVVRQSFALVHFAPLSLTGQPNRMASRRAASIPSMTSSICEGRTHGPFASDVAHAPGR